MTDTADDATIVLDDGPGGRRIVARGAFTIAHLARLAPPDGVPSGHDVTLDISGVGRLDTSGAFVLHRLLREAGEGARLAGATPEAERLIAAAAEHDKPVPTLRNRPHTVTMLLERIGRSLVHFANAIGGFLAFLGQTLIVLYAVFVGRSRLRWNAVVHQMEAIGVNALGIVGVLLFLVGIVVAQQGATQLKQFGAEVFTVNLIGRSVCRELGVLLTAIMIAGRSSSAFAAQIGSMKLNEEVDAMRTIGMSPIEVLVLPRIVAMTTMALLLAFYGSAMAIMGGGLFAWVSLGMPPGTFLARIQEVTPRSDLLIGMFKAPVFGLVIAVMGCFQGMQVTGNAESVGQRTTQAVVQSIFLVIVLDAFFAVFFSALGFN
jgi:phospholipid/cholesterol/gamma-HCH transport system permease protein